MNITKQCQTCKQAKPLGEFFSPPQGAATSWQGTGAHCKHCHKEAKVQHGYGYYGEKHTGLDDTPIVL